MSFSQAQLQEADEIMRKENIVGCDGHMTAGFIQIMEDGLNNHSCNDAQALMRALDIKLAGYGFAVRTTISSGLVNIILQGCPDLKDQFEEFTEEEGSDIVNAIYGRKKEKKE